MMNEHKVVIEMIVGQALPSASGLQEVLDEINRDIRVNFARNDWYVEIKKVEIDKVIHEQSSGNVFADLDINNAVELNAHGRIGCLAVSLLRERNMENRELADLLGVKQVDIVHLMNGYFDLFSTATLLDFIARLANEKSAIQVTHLSADDTNCDVVYVSSEKGVLHKDGLAEEEFSQEMRKLMNTLIIGAGENE